MRVVSRTYGIREERAGACAHKSGDVLISVDGPALYWGRLTAHQRAFANVPSVSPHQPTETEAPGSVTTSSHDLLVTLCPHPVLQTPPPAGLLHHVESWPVAPSPHLPLIQIHSPCEALNSIHGTHHVLATKTTVVPARGWRPDARATRRRRSRWVSAGAPAPRRHTIRGRDARARVDRAQLRWVRFKRDGAAPLSDLSRSYRQTQQWSAPS
jgi:hypothetical protein